MDERPSLRRPTCMSPLRKRSGTGATAIKIYADLTAQLVAAITTRSAPPGHVGVGSCHRLSRDSQAGCGGGRRQHFACAHVGHNRSRQNLCGAHLHPAAEQQYADGFGPQLSSLLREMKARDTILDATLVVFKEWTRLSQTSVSRTQ